MITKADIQQSQAINASAKQWAIAHLDYLNKPMALFGSSNKVEKGADKFDTYIMYLQPADKVATATLCAAAESSGCKSPCLISSGQLGMSTGQNAATKRTVLLLLRPALFAGQLLKEIDKAERKALKTSIPALFRLNGTSDLDWSHIINKRPASMFYDYSKILSLVRKNTLANYDLTYSASMYSKQSRAAFKKAVKTGHRIAVAFNTKNLSSEALQVGHTMPSFDTTDLRHLDGQVVGTLTRKGSNKAERLIEDAKEHSFFITSANLKQFNDIIAIGG